MRTLDDPDDGINVEEIMLKMKTVMIRMAGIMSKMRMGKIA